MPESKTPAAASPVHHTGNGKAARPAPNPPPLLKALFAEFLGTLILVFIGCGAVHASVLLGAQMGLWQVAIVWALGIILAVYVTADASGAHLNPAITLAMTLLGRFTFWRTIPYIVSQFAGASAAAALLFVMFSSQLAEKEERTQLYRGDPGSESTAMCYGEFFPNPLLYTEDSAAKDLSTKRGVKELAEEQKLAARGPSKTRRATLELYKAGDKDGLAAQVSLPAAFMAEALGTALLALVIFAVTDSRNRAAPGANLGPVFIGLTVAALISVIAPLTQACFNPARDFGPRAVAYCLGWGPIAWPGWRGDEIYYVYALAPVVGALIGGGIYEKLLRRNEGA